MDFATVDRWLGGLFAENDPVTGGVLAASAAAGLPAHQVSPLQGRLLALLARSCGARAILELGTLGGYSTVWLARALAPGGRLVTIEADAAHAEVARDSFAGLPIDLRVGRALDVLPALDGPFDFIFIDADKPGYPAYLPEALRLSRPGTLMVADNVVRGGAVADGASADAAVQGVRRFLALAAAEPRLDCTVIQTVGEKGWDGFWLARVR
jgi:predicted O-methyltransferase YrrM